MKGMGLSGSEMSLCFVGIRLEPQGQMSNLRVFCLAVLVKGPQDRREHQLFCMITKDSPIRPRFGGQNGSLSEQKEERELMLSEEMPLVPAIKQFRNSFPHVYEIGIIILSVPQTRNQRHRDAKSPDRDHTALCERWARIRISCPSSLCFKPQHFPFPCCSSEGGVNSAT